jgi:hypothetical protein
MVNDNELASKLVDDNDWAVEVHQSILTNVEAGWVAYVNLPAYLDVLCDSRSVTILL